MLSFIEMLPMLVFAVFTSKVCCLNKGYPLLTEATICSKYIIRNMHIPFSYEHYMHKKICAYP